MASKLEGCEDSFDSLAMMGYARKVLDPDTSIFIAEVSNFGGMFSLVQVQWQNACKTYIHSQFEDEIMLWEPGATVELKSCTTVAINPQCTAKQGTWAKAAAIRCCSYKLTWHVTGLQQKGHLLLSTRYLAPDGKFETTAMGRGCSTKMATLRWKYEGAGNRNWSTDNFVYYPKKRRPEKCTGMRCSNG